MSASMYDWRKPEVGDVVYPDYKPTAAGKIITIRGDRITVHQPSGEEWSAWTSNTRCFRTLIADHKRKLKTHEKKLKEVEA